MTLVICEECSKEVSTKAQACPHCGAPTEINHSVSQEPSFYYIVSDEKEIKGPYSAKDLKEAFDKGEIHEMTLVCPSGFDKWIALKENAIQGYVIGKKPIPVSESVNPTSKNKHSASLRVLCKTCGNHIDHTLEKCPHCSTRTEHSITNRRYDVNKWYYSRSNNEVVGPITIPELQKAFRLGEVDETSVVCPIGSKEWIKLKDSSIFADVSRKPNSFLKQIATFIFLIFLLFFYSLIEVATNQDDGMEWAKQKQDILGKSSLKVSHLEFKMWPLSVDKGVLKCEQGSAVYFISKGKKYAVNGTAMAIGGLDIDPIWEHSSDVPGTRINIGPLIDRGLNLCK